MLPLGVGQETSECTDALIVNLIEICTAERITLLSNEKTFKLKDCSNDDGYYLDDGSQSTIAGV